MSGSDNFWVKIGVIATVLGTVFGYLAVAAAVHWPPFDSLADSASGSPVNSYSYSSSPSPQSPTVDEVKAALLEPSDLTGIDANLTAEDVALPRSGSCQSFPVRPIINVTRQYKDGSSLILGDEIETFRSSADADAIFKLGMQNPTCSFTSP